MFSSTKACTLRSTAKTRCQPFCPCQFDAITARDSHSYHKCGEPIICICQCVCWLYWNHTLPSLCRHYIPLAAAGTLNKYCDQSTGVKKMHQLLTLSTYPAADMGCGQNIAIPVFSDADCSAERVELRSRAGLLLDNL